MIWINSLSESERLRFAIVLAGALGWSMKNIFNGEIRLAIAEMAFGVIFSFIVIELMRFGERRNARRQK